VLITADTHRLVSGLFVVEDRGPQVLKAVAGPVELYAWPRPDSRNRTLIDFILP
jgi:class 3 adenylate cyclase